jgi:hypothetical protein
LVELDGFRRGRGHGQARLSEEDLEEPLRRPLEHEDDRRKYTIADLEPTRRPKDDAKRIPQRQGLGTSSPTTTLRKVIGRTTRKIAMNSAGFSSRANADCGRGLMVSSAPAPPTAAATAPTSVIPT